MTLSNVIDQTKKARRSLYNCNGRVPQDEEIAKFTGLPLANVRLANKCSRAMGSIDQKIGDCMGVKFKVQFIQSSPFEFYLYNKMATSIDAHMVIACVHSWKSTT